MENVAHAIRLAVTDARAAGRTYNVGEADPLSRAAWIQAIGRVAGWTGAVVPLPQDQLPAHLQADYDWSQHLVTDTTRIRQELGYREVVSRDETLKRTVVWESTNPPVEVDPARFDYAAEEAVLAALDS